MRYTVIKIKINCIAGLAGGRRTKMKMKKSEIRVLNAVKDFDDPWHRVKAYNPVGRYFERVSTNGNPEEVQHGSVYGLGAPKNAERGART